MERENIGITAMGEGTMASDLDMLSWKCCGTLNGVVCWVVEYADLKFGEIWRPRRNDTGAF